MASAQSHFVATAKAMKAAQAAFYAACQAVDAAVHERDVAGSAYSKAESEFHAAARALAEEVSK